MLEVSKVGEKDDAAKIGHEAGEEIKAKAGAEFFKRLYEQTPTPPKPAAVA